VQSSVEETMFSQGVAKSLMDKGQKLHKKLSSINPSTTVCASPIFADVGEKFQVAPLIGTELVEVVETPVRDPKTFGDPHGK
jgi:hypothetical protein